MELLFTLMALACLAGVRADECHGLTEEELTKLKEMHVTDDVHDKFVGEHYDMWGPKVIYDMDSQSCFKVNLQKSSDTELTGTVQMKGDWFGGEETLHVKLTKVDNGVYLLKTKEGVSFGKMYILAAKGNILAKFTCLLHPIQEGGKRRLPRVASVGVHKAAVSAPLDTEDQAAMDAAVKKIRDAGESLMGEMVQYQNHDC